MTLLGRAVRLLPILALFVLVTACGGFFPPQGSVQSISVTPSSVILLAATSTTKGDTYTLTATSTTVAGTTTTDTKATWTSSDPTVVTAAAGGVLTVVGTTGGSTPTITAKDGGQSATAAVLTYTGTAPTTLSINIPSGLVPASIAPGQTFHLTATASINSDPNFNITNFVSWASGDTSVATVNATGFVTVLSTATVGTTFTVTTTANFGPAAAASTVTATSTTFTII